MVYPYNAILLSNKKNKLWKQKNESQKKNPIIVCGRSLIQDSTYYMIHLYKVLEQAKLWLKKISEQWLAMEVAVAGTDWEWAQGDFQG